MTVARVGQLGGCRRPKGFALGPERPSLIPHVTAN
jgi:hypothetical protein